MSSRNEFRRLSTRVLEKLNPCSRHSPSRSFSSVLCLGNRIPSPSKDFWRPSRPFSSTTSTMSTTTPHPDSPIHILGVGNLGKLFAHALTTSKSPSPITFLTHRPGLPYAFEKSGSTIRVVKDGAETSSPPGLVTIKPIKEHDTDPIKQLIVTTKATDTATALQPLVSRLGPESTLVFTQNGMGVIDEVNTLCFPEPEKRPKYLTAIVVHGVFNTGPFSATHAAVADCKIGFTTNGSQSGSEAAGSKELLNKIVKAEALAAKEVDPQELIAVQLEKLIANACINPLTVIFRTKNGGLLDPRVSPLRRVLCHEASQVFLRYMDRTVGLTPGLQDRFNMMRLEEMVKGVTERTRENKSSMYQDFDAGRVTEIRYINGWFARVGQEYWIDVRTHEKLLELVEEKAEVAMDDIREVFRKMGPR